MSDLDTIRYGGRLVVEVCWCGMRHAVPVELVDHQLQQFNAGETPIDIYCPLGHSWVPSGRSDLDLLKTQLRRAEARETALNARLDQEKASHAATKGQLTKARKRVAKGVCPCCNRSFVNVARHMASQHPDLDKAES